MENWQDFTKLFDAFGLRSDLRQFLSRTARPFLSGAPAAVVNYWQDVETDYGCKAIRDDIDYAPTFRYRSLPRKDGHDFVRLLKILPREPDGRLRCKLRTYALDDCPEYDALSYCWGDAAASISMACDSYELSVTPVVAAAISRLRLRRCRYLWIDSICINQDDMIEREQQVLLMRQIYTIASHVWLWIGGEEAPDALGLCSKVAFGGLKMFAEDPSATATTWKYGGILSKAASRQDAEQPVDSDGYTSDHTSGRSDSRSSRSVRHSREQTEIAKAETSQFTSALEYILQRKWFERMWCVQEALLNKHTTLICGPYEIEWDIFHTGLANAVKTDVACSQAFGAIQRDSIIVRKLNALAQLERPRSGDSAAAYLLCLLLRYRNRLSKDPRDKVYALLGLVDLFFGKPVLQPSYTSDIDEVYRMAAIYILGFSGSLNLFAACSSPQDKADLPSWVPDWSSSKSLPKPFSTGFDPISSPYKATGASIAEPTFSRDSMLVALEGQLIDRIEEVGDVLPLSELEGHDWKLKDYLKAATVDADADESDEDSGWKDEMTGFLTDRKQRSGLLQLIFGGRQYNSAEELLSKQNAINHNPALMQMMWVKMHEAIEESLEKAKPESAEHLTLKQRCKLMLSKSRPAWMEHLAGQRMKFIMNQIRVFLEWEQISEFKTTSETYPNGDDVEEAYWQTLCAGDYHESTRSTAKLFRQWRKALSAMRLACRLDVDRWNTKAAGMAYLLMPEIDKRWFAWQQETKFSALLEYAYQRKFARTKQGYFCLVPASARKGDHIGLFRGGTVPLVVRRRRSKASGRNDRGWYMIGESYVQGIMRGEAWSERDCETFWFR